MYTVWRTQLHFGYTDSKFNFLTCDELQAQCCMNGFFLPMLWGKPLHQVQHLSVSLYNPKKKEPETQQK